MLCEIQVDITTKVWCGPAAVATITGRPLSECIEVIKSVQGTPRRIVRVKAMVMIAALLESGCRVRPPQTFDLAAAPTLLQWASGRSAAQRASVVLLYVASYYGHWCVIQGRRFIDNNTLGYTAIRDAPCAQRRVRGAWIVESP